MSSGSGSAVPGKSYRAVRLVKIEKTMEAGIAGLEMHTLPCESLGSTEVRVQVHASAMNYFDLLQTVGRYQYKPPLPFTAGSEAAGVVVEVGSECTRFKVGDAVIAGMTNGGSVASEMVVQESLLIPKPPQFSFAEAAGLPVSFFTNWHALVHRGALREGETLLVTGAGGGMGLAAVQLGVQRGAMVIAAASSEAKCAAARAAGAHHTINYSDLAQLKQRVTELTEGRMADVCYEVVGGKVFGECVRCMAGGGRLLVVGFASGSIPTVAANLILVKGFSVVGVRSGQEMMDHPELTAEMIHHMSALATDPAHAHDRTLAPVTRCVTADNFREAYNLILRKEIIGKAVILWQPEGKAKL
jgi:NADPH2:quinone reductase